MGSFVTKRNFLLIVICLVLIVIALSFTKLNLAEYKLTLNELLESSVSVKYIDQQELLTENEINRKTIIIKDKEKLSNLYNYLSEEVVILRISPMEMIFGSSGNEIDLSVENNKKSIFFKISDKRIRMHVFSKDIKTDSYYFLLRKKNYQYIEELLTQ